MSNPLYGLRLDNLDTARIRAAGRCAKFLGNRHRSALYCNREAGHVGKCASQMARSTWGSALARIEPAPMTDNNPERWYHRCETPECCHYRRHHVIPRGDCSLCDHDEPGGHW